jgi:hypothetical protein
MNPRTRITRSTLVTWRPVGDDRLLVHPVFKQYHVLNAAAGRIWELADGACVAAVADTIAAEYGVDRETVIADVQDTAAGMADLQLLELT